MSFVAWLFKEFIYHLEFFNNKYQHYITKSLKNLLNQKFLFSIYSFKRYLKFLIIQIN